MSSLRSHEGYLLIDNRGTPGLSEEAVHSAGLPAGAGVGLFEAPTYTCSHCQTVVVLNPKRNRERAYCRGCDHMICDRCGVLRANGQPCKTFKQVIDEILEAATRQATPEGSIILP